MNAHAGAARTPLPYYGGKQMLAQRIASMMGPHTTYLEAFCGGAAVLFAKPRCERETINDLDGRVVNFWRVLRDQPDELARAVALTPYSRGEWEECRRAPDEGGPVEQARRFLVWTEQSFTRAWKGWSPPSVLRDRRGRWQPGVWQNMPARIIRAASRLTGVCVEQADGVELIGRFDHPSTVIYVDPPYAATHRLDPGHGYRHDADERLWPRLCEALSRVRHAGVILSGYRPDEHADALGWRHISFSARRHAQTREGRLGGVAPEGVWISPQITGLMRLFEEQR